MNETEDNKVRVKNLHTKRRFKDAVMFMIAGACVVCTTLGYSKYTGHVSDRQINVDTPTITADAMKLTQPVNELPKVADTILVNAGSGQNDKGNFTFSYYGYNDGKLHADIQFNDGSKYCGDFSQAGKIDGHGSISFTNGDYYSGQFSNGVRQGTGTYTWNNGDVYKGNWSDDAMSGNGRYTGINGIVYDGTFLNNSFESGTETVSYDDSYYQMDISYGTVTNLTAQLEDGTKYEGDINDGHFTGECSIEYNNGDSYEGDVIEGQKSGNGIYTWEDGASYDGEWRNDQINGRGTYKYANKKSGYKVKGKFKNGKIVGKCKYYKSKKKSYTAIWKNGKFKKVKK